MGYLGVAVLGVAVLGTAVLMLGVAVLGTAVLHRTLTHSAQWFWRPVHLSEHPKAWQSQVRVAMSEPDGKYLGVAVLGVAVLGTAVLGTAVLHRTLTHSAQPWHAPCSSIRASQSMAVASPLHDGPIRWDTLVWL